MKSTKKAEDISLFALILHEITSQATVSSSSCPIVWPCLVCTSEGGNHSLPCHRRHHWLQFCRAVLHSLWYTGNKLLTFSQSLDFSCSSWFQHLDKKIRNWGLAPIHCTSHQHWLRLMYSSMPNKNGPMWIAASMETTSRKKFQLSERKKELGLCGLLLPLLDPKLTVAGTLGANSWLHYPPCAHIFFHPCPTCILRFHQNDPEFPMVHEGCPGQSTAPWSLCLMAAKPELYLPIALWRRYGHETAEPRKQACSYLCPQRYS